eukprot:GFUD01038650.1.p1 GENE.GFUD01038650.1~~GFUD01038650.1.p1  ORF type:complete len:230 (+),score=81.08 GFUD01038650.1:47-691(+)
MAGKKTKGGIEDLKAFLNEVIEDITDEDENPVIRELGTKNENEKNNIDMDELRQIRKEISESIKDLEDPIKQSKPSTSEEVDTLARIDQMINAGKPEIQKIAKITEAAVPAEPVDERVEVVEVFEEKLIAKLGSKVQDSAKVDDIGEIKEEKDAIIDSQKDTIITSGSGVNNELSENSQDDTGGNVDENNNDFMMVAVMAAAAAFVVLFLKIML